MRYAIVLLTLLFISCQKPVDDPPPAQEMDVPTSRLQEMDVLTSPLYSWIELGPNGIVLARAIIPAAPAECPDIEIDGSTQPMTARGQAPPGFNDIQVCQYTIPDTATSASIGSQKLSLPSADPQHILVLGDTGCRIKGKDVQNCDDPQDWRFPLVASEVAANAPDLLVHVGDYHYREGDGSQQLSTCPTTKVGLCWASWEADFFAPVATLLPAAPWVFIRGNHEDCGTADSSSDPPRAWRGWFYFFEPRPLGSRPWDQDGCPAYTDPYLVPAGDQNLLVMDTSEIPDDYGKTPVQTTVDRYAHEFTLMDGLTRNRDRVWLTTHRPFWAVASWTSNATQKIATTDATLQAALAQSQDVGIPSSVDLLVAGHVHLFERLIFDDGRPSQLVFGGGGTELDPAITEALLSSNPAVLSSLGVKPSDFTTVQDIDYGIIVPTVDGWSITVKNVNGTIDATFDVSNQ